MVASPPDLIAPPAASPAQLPAQPQLTAVTTTPRLLVTHTYDSDSVLPAPREVIVIRLPNPLSGPGSAQGSLRNSSDYYTSTSTPHRRRLHNAFVISSVLDARREVIYLNLWPTPSYSGAIADGFSSSIAYVSSLGSYRRDCHIPVPFVNEKGLPTPETPATFGAPLVIGGYQDRQPSWVLMEPQRAVMRLTTKWKSFSPPVFLSLPEFIRLEDHYNRLSGNGDNPRTNIPRSLAPPAPDAPGPSGPDTNHFGGPNTGPAPGPGHAPRGGHQDTRHAEIQHQQASDFHADFWRGFENVPLLMIAESESGDDSADEEEGPISFARLLAPYSKPSREIVDQHDNEVARHTELRMMKWVDDVARGM